MQVFMAIGFLAIGIVQMFATFAGLESLTGSFFLTLIISLVIGGIPLIGSLTGVYGAVEVWGWEVWQAVILFFWFVPLLAAIFVLDVLEKRN